MITLTLYHGRKPGYAHACEFAKMVYRERLSVDLDCFPAVMLAAIDGNEIIGTFGFNPGNSRKTLLIDSYFDFDILSVWSAGKDIERGHFGELGTLAVGRGHKRQLSLVLSAAMIAWCYQNDYKFIALTTTKKIQQLAVPLEIDLIRIGEPNLEGKDEEFCAKWSRYFCLRPNSVGIVTEQAITGCMAALQALKCEIDYSGLLSC